MSELRPTLTNIIEDDMSVMGHELESIIHEAMGSLDEDEVQIAKELDQRYFAQNTEKNFKPIKFVFYRIRLTKAGDYILKRNLYLSPRASEYFDAENIMADQMQSLVVNKKSVLGSELKEIVNAMLENGLQLPPRGSTADTIQKISFSNLSRQLASYIYDYFINCEKPIKDDVWYVVACKEYGTATIYRDLEKSPRTQQAQN